MSTPPPPAGAPGPTSDDRSWAVGAHLSALVALAGVPSFVGPLVVWLVRRDRPFVEEHGRDALNFNLSFLLYVLVGGVVVVTITVLTLGLFVLVLFPLVIAVVVVWVVFVVQGAMRASRGESYRYPLTIRFIT